MFYRAKVQLVWGQALIRICRYNIPIHSSFSNLFLTNATKLRYHRNMKKIEEIFTVLKTKHLRLTKTRKVLLELFFRYETPLSAQIILREFGKVYRVVNKTTIYRELERLERVGLIGTVQLGDRTTYYELTIREHHHHLVCLHCEKVEDVDIDEKIFLAEEKKVSREKNFVISRHALEFFGLCKMCN